MTIQSHARRERSADLAAVRRQLNIPVVGEWEHRAACGKHNPRLWELGATPGEQEEARSICQQQCPVMRQCRERRLQVGGVGTWGGVTYERSGGRQCVRRGCEARVTGSGDYCSFECNHAVHVGTEAGWRLHNKHKVATCRACAGRGPHSNQDAARQAPITKEEAYRIPSTTRRGGVTPAYNAHI